MYRRILILLYYFIFFINPASADLDKIHSLPVGISIEKVVATLGYSWTVKTEVKSNIFQTTFKTCEDCHNSVDLYFKDNKYLGLITVGNLGRCEEFQELYSKGAVEKDEVELECKISAEETNKQIQLNNIAIQQQMIEQQRFQQLYNTLNHIDERNRQRRLDEERRTQQAIDNARAILSIQHQNPPDQPFHLKQTDYKCMNDCQNLKYAYGYCQSVCSY